MVKATYYPSGYRLLILSIEFPTRAELDDWIDENPECVLISIIEE